MSALSQSEVAVSTTNIVVGAAEDQDTLGIELVDRLDREQHRSLQDINYWAKSYDSIAELDAYAHGDYIQGDPEYDHLTMTDLAYSIDCMDAILPHL